MAVNVGNVPEPIGNAPRDFISASTYSADDIAREDFMRDIQRMEYANRFSAQESAKQKIFEKEMSDTAYQRAVADMKKAGINPILGLGLSGASTPSVSSASGSVSSNKGHTGSGSGLLGLLSSIAQIVAGIYTSGASNATKLAVANTVKKTENYNQSWIHNLSSKRKK